MTKQNHLPQTEQDQNESPASNATGSCIGAEKAAVKDTVQKPAGRQPTESEGDGNQTGGRNGSIETQQTDQKRHVYRPAGFHRTCNRCGRSYVAKRSSSRYCSGACRKGAFDARQAAKGSAGG